PFLPARTVDWAVGRDRLGHAHARVVPRAAKAFSRVFLRAGSPMAEHMPPVEVTQEKDIRVIEFTNNKILDEANIADIQSTLNALIEEQATPKLLLDFSTVDHLSSAALGALINVNNKIRQKNGQLRLSNIKPQIYEVFVITKLNKLFKILPTRTEALANFAP